MTAILKHAAPIHPGTGTGQDVHRGGGSSKLWRGQSGEAPQVGDIIDFTGEAASRNEDIATRFSGWGTGVTFEFPDREGAVDAPYRSDMFGDNKLEEEMTVSGEFRVASVEEMRKTPLGNVIYKATLERVEPNLLREKLTDLVALDTLNLTSQQAEGLRAEKRMWMEAEADRRGYGSEAYEAIDEALDQSTDSLVWSRTPFADAVANVRAGNVTTDLEKGVVLQRAYTDAVWEAKYGNAETIPVSRVTVTDSPVEPLTSWTVRGNEGEVEAHFRDIDDWHVAHDQETFPRTTLRSDVAKGDVYLLPWGEARYRSGYVVVKGEVLVYSDGIKKHAAPIHPGTGTGQEVHGGKGGSATSTDKWIGILSARGRVVKGQPGVADVHIASTLTNKKRRKSRRRRLRDLLKHGGGSHDDTDHGNWADGVTASDEPIDPKARIKGQRRLFASKTVGPQEAIDRWRATLDDPPDDWDPNTLDIRIAELGMDEVTPEFREWVDKGISEVLSEGRIGDFAEKYGESQWIVITKGQFGEKNTGYLGQFFDSWGDQIAIYESGYTTPYEGQAEEKMWHNKDVLHVAHDLSGDTQDRLPSHAPEGMKGTMRHEYGHYIMSQLTSDQRHEWVDKVYGARMVEMGADGPSNYGMLGSNSEKQYDWYQKPDLGGTFPSTYAMVNDREGFAETFAIVTHPDFDRNEFDPEIYPMFDFVEGLV